MTKGKDEFWQVIRGICILAVTMIHSPSASGYPIGSVEFNSWLILRQFINFPVAIFFFMSGYFTKIEDVRNDARTYVLKRGGRLLIPFVLWSTFYSAISIVGDILDGDRIDWVRYILRFVAGRASTPLYYIVALIQMVLLTPICIRIIKNHRALSNGLWALTPIALLVIYCGDLTDKYGTLAGAIFPTWFFFYYLGLHVKMDKTKWNAIANKFGSHWGIGIVLVFSIVEAFLILKLGNGASLACSQSTFGSYLYAFCIILFLLKVDGKREKIKPGIDISNKKIWKMLKTTGDCSFGMYFIHCFILMFVRKAMQLVGMDSIWILYFALTWIVISASSLAVVMVANRLLGQNEYGKKILAWVGFR